ncbi:MAG TPA: hypothetical protein VG815_12600 [Chloroflexota bacterium]|nr:hypothetical protein [Chloroflexota bacterium]
MVEEKRYWVKYVGAIQMAGGFDAQSPILSEFLGKLSVALRDHDDLTHSAVISPGGGKIVFTTVVRASSKDGALVRALGGFDACITRAGWHSNLGTSGDVRELERRSRTVTASLTTDAEGRPVVEELVGTR